jgi:hypothetical protein
MYGALDRGQESSLSGRANESNDDDNDQNSSSNNIFREQVSLLQLSSSELRVERDHARLKEEEEEEQSSIRSYYSYSEDRAVGSGESNAVAAAMREKLKRVVYYSILCLCGLSLLNFAFATHNQTVIDARADDNGAHDGTGDNLDKCKHGLSDEGFAGYISLDSENVTNYFYYYAPSIGMCFL